MINLSKSALSLTMALLVAAAVPALAQDAPAEPAQDTANAPASAEGTATTSEDASSAAAPAPQVVTAPAPPPAAAPAPAVAQLNPVSAPPEGMAQIVFFRPGGQQGMLLKFSIREGDEGVAKLSSGSYYVHVTEPGLREYTIESEATDSLRLEIEEGETYYVMQSMAMGVFVGRPNLSPSTEAAFQKKKLKVTTSVATDRN